MTGEISRFDLESNVIKDHGSQTISEFNGHLTHEIDKELIIKPYQGVGPIALGMTVEEVRSVLGREVKSFRKTPDSEMLTDAFVDLGIHVFYKHPGLCEAIEMFAPARPIWQGKKLMGSVFSELEEWLSKIDQTLVVDELGLTSLQLGIGLYAPDLGQFDRAIVKGVIVFEKGYYN